MKKRKHSVLRTLFILAFLGLLLFAGFNVYIIAYASPYIYDIGDVPNGEYQASIALGAKVHPSGQLSYTLRDRVEYAVNLYQDGITDKVLLSGDHGAKMYDEVNAMMNKAQSMGVPDEDIFLDHAGFDTYDSMVRAKKVFDCEHVIVVTQPFHLYRAIYIARKNGLDAIGVKADQTNFVRRLVIKNRVREFLARVKAFVEVEVLKPDPKYLGDVIPITGDGTMTHDE